MRFTHITVEEAKYNQVSYVNRHHNPNNCNWHSCNFSIGTYQVKTKHR